MLIYNVKGKVGWRRFISNEDCIISAVRGLAQSKVKLTETNLTNEQHILEHKPKRLSTEMWWKLLNGRFKS